MRGLESRLAKRSRAWATAPAEDKILLLDLVGHKQIAEVAVPGGPHGMVLSPDGTRLYVVQRKLNQLAIIDVATRKVERTQALGSRPDMLAITPDGQTLFVISRNDDKLYKVAAADLRVLGSVGTDREPHGVAYRP